jgi:pimeloyl-ACP methyl ester carboxylesterase
MANQMRMVFSRLDCKPRWRERLPEIEVPTLVVHGRRQRSTSNVVVIPQARPQPTGALPTTRPHQQDHDLRLE